MLRKLALTAQSVPFSLSLANVKTYVVIAVFTALSVLTPWLLHQYPAAGPTWLPMHFFVFIAALSFGWQAGVIVGLATPLASFAITGMPPSMVLPQVLVEVTVYGLVAGRAALLVAVFAVQAATGHVYSPLGPSATPTAAVWNTISQAWPGIVLQIALIPVVMLIVGRAVKRES